MTSPVPDPLDEHFYTAAEVAALFRVDPKTVGLWSRSGKLPAIRTPGGHRRYREADVRALLEATIEHKKKKG